MQKYDGMDRYWHEHRLLNGKECCWCLLLWSLVLGGRGWLWWCECDWYYQLLFTQVFSKIIQWSFKDFLGLIQHSWISWWHRNNIKMTFIYWYDTVLCFNYINVLGQIILCFHLFYRFSTLRQKRHHSHLKLSKSQEFIAIYLNR